MQRFEVIPTLDGAEVFDNVAGRPVDFRRSAGAAETIARQLNERIERLRNPENAAKSLVAAFDD